ncbi:hypothetical protein FA95DRAFT_699318 [Auriscalpium vulgare]|uniref:Uncharacterized protein n=1 Tax=Auriscalpium vulgare TaxID=40419 RepID=A0ACB8S1I5_9AGAM|nr:hypothetical protein FA95DRAFT_699318 [Auriscalpium vulgare]
MSATGVPALDATMGGLFIGIIVGATLWGITALQTWYYYREYPNDPWHFQLLVGLVFTLDTVHQIFISHTGYSYLVSNFFNPAYLEHVTWSILAEVLISGVVAVLVQSFFVGRIYTLSKKNLYVTGVVVILILAQFGVTLAYCSRAFTMSTYTQIATIKGLSMAINGTTAATDLAIAVVLCSLLHKSRTGFRRSDTLINKLIIFTVNTGLLTSLDAICSLATIAALPDKFVYISFFFALSRLYANSLLATLNARARFRGDSEVTSSISLSAINNVRPGAVLESVHAHAMGVRSQSNNIAIRIDTTKQFNSDRDGEDMTDDRKL